MRFDLSDEEWTLLEPLMPKSRKSARADDRKIMNAIFYVLRAGMPWRDLTERYGPYTTAYDRFNRWSRRGIWKRGLNQLPITSRDGLRHCGRHAVAIAPLQENADNRALRIKTSQLFPVL